MMPVNNSLALLIYKGGYKGIYKPYGEIYYATLRRTVFSVKDNHPRVGPL
jgi:hypothetical protein